MLSILDLRARIEAGTLTPAGAIDLCRAALAAREPELRALVTLDDDPVIPDSGPLAGIAVGVKDIIDSAGLPTQMGSALYEGWRPRGDSAVVARLKGLGAVALAKTTTTAFCQQRPDRDGQPARSRPQPGRILGGLGRRGGGGAAAPRARHPDGGLGDPAGELLRLRGGEAVLPADPDGRGEDLFLGARHGRAVRGRGRGRRPRPGAGHRPPGDRPGEPGSAPRIGLVRQDFAEAPEPEAEAALARARQAAERSGAQVTDLALPPELALAWSATDHHPELRGPAGFGLEYDSHRDALPPRVREHLDAGAAIAAAEYDDARRHAHRPAGCSRACSPSTTRS